MYRVFIKYCVISLTSCDFPELKTEEGYSADIYPWRYMTAQLLTAIYDRNGIKIVMVNGKNNHGTMVYRG